MDNQTPNSQNDWVDTRLASLAPPRDWHPDSKRSLAQILKRRERQEAAGSPRWIQLSMAGAVLLSIGLVVTLLPWQALWKLGTEDKSRLHAGPVKAEISELVPEPTPSPAQTPPVRPQPPAAAVAAIPQNAKPEAEKGQEPVEHGATEETVPQTISPKSEPEYTDEARRAHIQGTVVEQQVGQAAPRATPPRAIPPTPEPDYTDEARQAHIQGTVVLNVTIHADGTAKVDSIARALGYGLDEKAVATVEKWKFTPGTIDGKPVNVQLQIVINFHLN